MAPTPPSQSPGDAKPSTPHRKGYLRIPDAIAQRTDLSAAAKLVAGVLARLQGDGTSAWPSYAAIGRLAGISRRQAMRCIDQLCAAGLLSILPGGAARSPNLYAVRAIIAANLGTRRANRRRGTEYVLAGDRMAPVT